MSIILRLAINIIAVFVAAWVLESPIQSEPVNLALFAAVLGLINAFIKPLVTILALPAVVLTLGLFILVINALLFWLADLILGARGFGVNDFWKALAGSLIVSVVSWFLSVIIPDKK